MYRRLIAAALFAGTMAFTATAQAQQTLDELYKAAQGEGPINFGGAMREDATQIIIDAFQQRFPGVMVNYTRRSTEPMVQLIESDRVANRVSFDLINLTEPADLVRWKTDGFTAAFKYAELDKLRPESYDPDGHFYAIGITPMVGIYNTNRLNAETAPTSLTQLLEPEWKGSVAISRPSRGGTGTAALMNVVDTLGKDFIQKAPGLDILLTRGNEAAISAVVSGERQLSWGVSGYRALEARAEGAPVQLLWWKEGVALSSFSATIPDKAPNPNGARLLLSWLLSDEGQKLIVKHVNFYSSRTDVEETPYGEPPLSELTLKNFTTEQILNEGHVVAAEFDKAVGLD